MSEIVNKYEKKTLKMLWRIVLMAAVFAGLQILFPESAFTEDNVTTVFTLTLVIYLVGGFLLYEIKGDIEALARLQVSLSALNHIVNMLIASDMDDRLVDEMTEIINALIRATTIDDVYDLVEELEALAREMESDEPPKPEDNGTGGSSFVS